MSTPQNTKCRICGMDAVQGPDWVIQTFDCLRCGQYQFDSTVGWLEVKSPQHMVRLSGWTREQNAAGITPNITPDVSRRVAAMALPSLRERARKALKIVTKEYGDLHSWYDPQDIARTNYEMLGSTYSLEPSEVLDLFEILFFEGLLLSSNVLSNNGLFHLSVPGLLAVEDMSRSSVDSLQGFVAMDFADSMRDAWTSGFDPAIRAAGFMPMRIDAKDYVGGITDEIISEIRQSRFLVADYTGQKAGVYFEAGFALGFGITVIPTCRSDQITGLHFDIRHLNTLPWNTPHDLAQTLAQRIRAVVGVSPVPPELSNDTTGGLP